MVILETSKLLGSITPHACHKHSATFCPSHVNNASVRMSLASNRSSSNPILIAKERTRVCELFDLHKKLIHYDEARTWQKSVVREKKALLDRNEDFPDTLVVLQHHPVFTMGTGSSKEYLNFDIKNASYDVYQTERGGEVTYHGPGQLVVYPIINLRNHKMDLHWYLRALEEVVIRVLSLTFSIKACRVEGFTGVWVGNQKLAAIGIRVFQWITYHGLALNVTTDLTPFQQIVPCGIKDREVGSIEGTLRELGLSNRWETPTPDLVDCQLIEVAHKALVKEFSEVFQVELHWKPISMLG